MKVTDDNDDQDPAGPTVAAQALGSAAGALVGLTPAGPLVGAALTPTLIGLGQKVLDEVRGRSSASVAMLLQHSGRRLGVDPEEVQPIATASLEGEALFVDSVRAASETLDQRKIAALAMALANGLRDDQATIDEERLVTRALALLEAPHIRMLSQLTVPSQVDGKRGGTGSTSVIAVLASLGLVSDDNREAAQKADKESMEKVFNVMKELARAQDAIAKGRSPAMPRTPTNIEAYRQRQAELRNRNPTWRRTSFGTRCLDCLRTASADAGLDVEDLGLGDPRRGN